MADYEHEPEDGRPRAPQRADAGGREEHSEPPARSGEALGSPHGQAVMGHEPLPGPWERFARALAEGRSHAEARQAAGVSAERALDYLNRGETARRVIWLVRQAMEISAGEAGATLRASLAAESERVRLEAALAILDRSGVGKASEATSPVSIHIDLRSS